MKNLEAVDAMKLADYVIAFLASRGVTHVFGMSGGAAVHLFDAAARCPTITPIFSQHEQASAMAADGYSRTTGKLGVAVATSGPGAMNLLTGTACSYYDSVPVMMVTGQVATYRLKGQRSIRQLGFQETDVLSIFDSVTKYAVQIEDPNTIRFHLEAAFFSAFDGRPGAVLIDIPDDLQRSLVRHDEMPSFELPNRDSNLPAVDDIDAVLTLLKSAARPVLIVGGGLTTPWQGQATLALIERLGIPVIQTWAGLSLLPGTHPLRVGAFGVYGPRLGNYVVQNADLLLCIGTRLSQNVTGGVLESFAREAKIVMIDVSPGEFKKFEGRGIDVHLGIETRAEQFISSLLDRHFTLPSFSAWHQKIHTWRTALPNEKMPTPPGEVGHIDANDLVSALSEVIPAEEIIFADTGGNLTWLCNGIVIRPGQRLYSAWNNTPMGYALPAAIGAAFGCPDKGVTCVIGDGGLMLCLGELSTLRRHQLPIKVIVFNNHGHGIQKQTLDTWLEGRHVGVDEPSGLSFADFSAVGRAIGLPVVQISDGSQILPELVNVYNMPGPVLCIVEVRPDQKLLPFLKFGAALEEQQPALDASFISEHMVIDRYEPRSHAPLTPVIGL